MHLILEIANQKPERLHSKKLIRLGLVIKAEDGSGEPIELHDLLDSRRKHFHAGPNIDRLTLHVRPGPCKRITSFAK